MELFYIELLMKCLGVVTLFAYQGGHTHNMTSQFRKQNLFLLLKTATRKKSELFKAEMDVFIWGVMIFATQTSAICDPGKSCENRLAGTGHQGPQDETSFFLCFVGIYLFVFLSLSAPTLVNNTVDKIIAESYFVYFREKIAPFSFSIYCNILALFLILYCRDKLWVLLPNTLSKKLLVSILLW